MRLLLEPARRRRGGFFFFAAAAAFDRPWLPMVSDRRRQLSMRCTWFGSKGGKTRGYSGTEEPAAAAADDDDGAAYENPAPRMPRCDRQRNSGRKRTGAS